MATQFETVEWAVTGNVYEVNIRQYTKEGTFKAFEESLPRLKDMGVQILWFMPITPISKEKRQGTLGSYYACSNYTAINEEFGTIDDFKQLVTSAHAEGLKVIIDWVANHTGYDHVWTKEHPDFYKTNEKGEFYEAYGWQDVIDLDYGNKALWQEMLKAMNFWLIEANIDGFRCDMAHLVPLEFWKFIRTGLEEEKKLFWLAECEEPNYHEVFDATYSWEFLHTMEALYRKEADLKKLMEVLLKYEMNFPPNALRLMFTTNHDENSHSGSEYERFGDSAKTFATLCATWKNSLPLIYSGQELPNKKRLKFFDKDQIDWTRGIFLHDFYRTLLNLRNQNAAMLSIGEVEVKILQTTAPENILAFQRQLKQAEVIVILNLSDASKLVFNIMDNLNGGKFRSAFSGVEIEITNAQRFELQSWEYLVYYKVN